MKSKVENLPNSPKMVKIMTMFMVLKRNNKYKDTTGIDMKEFIICMEQIKDNAKTAKIADFAHFGINFKCRIEL